MKFQDQTGSTIEIFSANRIISIVPSQTEFLVDIGLREKLVGVTKFCVHPKGLIQSVGHVGGTKNLNLEKIKALKPDLIIGNKEENTKEEIEALSAFCPVWLSDIITFQDAIEMMECLGEITGATEETKDIINQVEKERKSNQFSNAAKKSCLYFIWKDPEMLVGSENFIHSMIKEAGLLNLGIDQGKRYPVLNRDNLKEIPDYILLSSEPYPFKERDKGFFQDLFPDSQIALVDGEMFSWYGSRLKKSFKYFAKLNQLMN